MVEGRHWVAVGGPARAGALLRLGPGPLTFSWACPAREQWAVGLGVATETWGEISWDLALWGRAPGPWFGGWSFDGRERWVLPEVLGWWAEGRPWLAAFGPSGTEAALRARLARVEEVEPSEPAPSAQLESGPRASWDDAVRAAVDEIANGSLVKVVLARALRAQSDQPIDERRLLKVLEARFPTCTTFLFRQPDGSALVGASPETLCRVQGDRLQTEALAGTAPAGQGEALLRSDKDLREHQLVVEGIVTALRPLCSEVQVASAPELLPLANVVHLRTSVSARLRPGVGAVEAARALHPTPAVAGTPRAAALRFLREHEGLDRGWYAGAVGLRGEGALQLAVALRCAVVQGRNATIFAGAGIVAGSSPEAEWAETARKAQAMAQALGAGDA